MCWMDECGEWMYVLIGNMCWKIVCAEANPPSLYTAPTPLFHRHNICTKFSQYLHLVSLGIYICNICRKYSLCSLLHSLRVPTFNSASGPFFPLHMRHCFCWSDALCNILQSLCSVFEVNLKLCVFINPTVIEFLWYLDWLRRKEISRHFRIFRKKWKNSSGSSGSNCPPSSPAGM